MCSFPCFNGGSGKAANTPLMWEETDYLLPTALLFAMNRKVDKVTVK